jgi:hypothetical protein
MDLSPGTAALPWRRPLRRALRGRGVAELVMALF